MKTLWTMVGVCFLSLWFCMFTFAQNIMTEDFNYPVRDSLEGIGGWFRSGINTVNNIRIVSPGLTFSGYQGSGVGNAVLLSNEASGDIVIRDFKTQTSGSVYLSCMIAVDTLATTATSGYVLGFDEESGSTNLNTRLYIRRLGETHHEFGIAKLDTVVYSSSSHQTRGIHLIVLKYTFVPGGTRNDTAKIFVFHDNPPLMEPDPDAVCVAASDITNLGQVFITNSYAQDGLLGSRFRIDGIRVGTSWAGAVLNSVNDERKSAPEAFVLEQNYPNPFNPRTTIGFRIGEAGMVRLGVYDLLGREITTLVNERLAAGEYAIPFDASGLGSGLYLYRITAPGFSRGKTMVLLK